MPTINQLTAMDTANSADQLPCYNAGSGDARRMPLSVLLAYIQRNMNAEFEEYTTQYSAPSATGFSVTIDSSVGNVHLILTPTGAFAAGTIVLPPFPGVADKQEVLVNCTQSVATLTLTASGATAVTGAPTSLAANGFFRLKFDELTKTYFRVG